MKQKPTKGVVLGDFSPLTNALVYLIEFALGFVDELTIVVDEHKADTIPVEVRVKWLSEMFPTVPVKRVKSAVWHKSDDKGFSPSLVAGVRRLVPKTGGFIFSLEERGKLIAAQIGATFMPVDPVVIGHKASERDVRKDPLKHWEELPRCVRPYFVRKVCVFGPESTGKSTLAVKLAQKFGTIAVPEYAKTYIASQGRDITSDDMIMIARGQLASEDALARDANRVIFCDSDLVTSSIWSGRLIGTIPEWLVAEANKRHYDLYLLTSIDVPWVNDVHRYIPKDRQSFLDRCILELETRERNFTLVSGGWDEREAAAIKAVEEMLATSR